MKAKVALLGIGQTSSSPPGETGVSDPDYSLLGQHVTCNPLDKFTAHELTSEFVPQEDEDMPINATIQNGSRINISRRKLVPLLQTEIRRLAREGVLLLLIDCTSDFDELQSHSSNTRIIFPGQTLHHATRLWISKTLNSIDPTIAILVPVVEQEDAIRKRWNKRHLTRHEILVLAINPNAETEEFVRIAQLIKSFGTSLLIMDCMGYSLAQARTLELHAQSCKVFSARAVALDTIQSLLVSS